MCTSLPRNTAQFGRITGVGERKLDRYGARFLQVINEHTGPAQEAGARRDRDLA